MKPLATICKVGLVCALWVLADAASAARVALVIGNAAYASGPLKNPVNDARAMDQKLSGLGFKVQRVENLKRQQIGRTLAGFASSVHAGDEVVVFYAGHGVQVKGVNYLPAVDADIQNEDDVALNSLNLNSLMDRLDEAKAGLKILFLDACRNNPYARSFRGGDRGLARLDSAPSGTLIHFATRPGSVAADGDGSNGLYTSQLLKFLDTPNVPVETMLKRVSAAVEAASGGQQEPWTEGSIKGDFYFKPNTVSSSPSTTVASLEPQPANPVPAAPTVTHGVSLDDLAKEEASRQQWAAWQQRMQADFDKTSHFKASPAVLVKAWELFLSTWASNNPYSSLDKTLRAQAQLRLDQAKAAAATDAAPSTAVVAAPVVSNPAPSVPIPVVRPSAEAPVPSGQLVQDCPDCPKLVLIPAGSFTMGSASGDADERPLHKVNINSYLLGQTLVTQAQWKAIMGSNPSAFKNCGGDCPVENVSWLEAQAFASALSQKTGKSYRLATESEWEYAARAGASSRWSYGDSEASLVQYAWYNVNSDKQTHSVALKTPNAWGLYDMQGNVSEWVQDSYHGSYGGAPGDGSAWTSGSDGARRVLRGGSWSSSALYLRPSSRSWYASDYRGSSVGLRIARNP